MTDLVRQRHKNDCFLCCIIMAIGTTYETAAEKWGAEFVGAVAETGLYGQESIRRAFGAFGLEMNRDYISMLGPASGVPAEFAPRTSHLKSLLWGRRALVQVVSKNYAGQSHIIYWDGAQHFDPSPLKTYAWDEVEPQHVWLFRESPCD